MNWSQSSTHGFFLNPPKIIWKKKFSRSSTHSFVLPQNILKKSKPKKFSRQKIHPQLQPKISISATFHKNNWPARISWNLKCTGIWTEIIPEPWNKEKPRPRVNLLKTKIKIHVTIHVTLKIMLQLFQPVFSTINRHSQFPKYQYFAQ